MTLAALQALDEAAKAQYGKRAGELPCKYMTTVSGALGTQLAAHTPTKDLRGSGTKWALTQFGAKQVWANYVAPDTGLNLRLRSNPFATAVAAMTVIPVAPTTNQLLLSNGNNLILSNGNDLILSGAP